MKIPRRRQDADVARMAEFLRRHGIDSFGPAVDTLTAVAWAFSTLPFENLTKIIKDAEAGRAESARRTRRSFLVAAAAAAGGYGFYRWIDRSPGEQLIQRPLRRMLDFNAKLSRAVFEAVKRDLEQRDARSG